jgi:hypothetical protein
MTTHYTKRPFIPNGRKIFQMVIKYNNIFHSKALQIWIFGLKTDHLATQNQTREQLPVERVLICQARSRLN